MILWQKMDSIIVIYLKKSKNQKMRVIVKNFQVNDLNLQGKKNIDIHFCLHHYYCSHILKFIQKKGFQLVFPIIGFEPMTYCLLFKGRRRAKKEKVLSLFENDAAASTLRSEGKIATTKFNLVFSFYFPSYLIWCFSRVIEIVEL